MAPERRHSHLTHPPPERGVLRIPVWSLGILLTLLGVGVGGYVEMATKYTALADAVAQVAAHEAGMDAKLDALNSLSTRTSLLEQQLTDLRAQQERDERATARATYRDNAP